MTHSPRGLLVTSVLGEAVELLNHHQVTGMMVIDSQGYLCGVITEFDCLEILTDPAKAMEPISNHMSPALCTVDEEMTLVEVDEVFKTHRIRRVPVLRDNKLIGIISRSDLIKYLAENVLSAFV